MLLFLGKKKLKDKEPLMRKIENQLPILENVRSMYPSLVLDDAYLIFAQHILKTSTNLFYELFQMGLNQNFFSVIGKCY